MKKLSFLFLCFFISVPFFANAQIFYDPIIYDSVTFTFAPGDSLVHHIPAGFFPYPVAVKLDTSSTRLWQIGTTAKPVFSGTTPVRAIMTDSVRPYRRNVNDYFVLKLDTVPINCIIAFWHKYQTDSFHAGGVVEFSTDTGLTWMNVANCAAIGTDSFYSATDTLFSGAPAFSGNCVVEKRSRLQFINCVGVKSTSTGCYFGMAYIGPFYLRFRFASDTATDTLSGWIIDSIKVESPGCIPGTVPRNNQTIATTVTPNPAHGTVVISSAQKIKSVIMTNTVGWMVMNKEFDTDSVQIDVANLPPGIYMLRINGTEVRKLVIQ